MSSHTDLPTSSEPVPSRPAATALLALTKTLAGLHVVAGLGVVLWALVGFLSGLTTPDVGASMAGVGIFFALGLAVVLLPALLLCTLSLASRRPRRAHGLALAAAVVLVGLPALGLLVTDSLGWWVFLLAVPALYLEAFSYLPAVVPALMGLSALAGLVVTRSGRPSSPRV